jgi:hypothetical protein
MVAFFAGTAQTKLARRELNNSTLSSIKDKQSSIVTVLAQSPVRLLAYIGSTAASGGAYKMRR